jgi:hypothetical protein
VFLEVPFILICTGIVHETCSNLFKDVEEEFDILIDGIDILGELEVFIK